MIWKLVSFCIGYREARDVEDDRLVVFREADGRWFYSWREAALANWSVRS
jgi:hypothetical protein